MRTQIRHLGKSTPERPGAKGAGLREAPAPLFFRETPIAIGWKGSGFFVAKPPPRR